MEVAMVADEGAFIGGVALTMTAITLLVSSRAGQLCIRALSRARNSGSSGSSGYVACRSSGRGRGASIGQLLGLDNSRYVSVCC